MSEEPVLAQAGAAGEIGQWMTVYLGGRAYLGRATLAGTGMWSVTIYPDPNISAKYVKASSDTSLQRALEEAKKLLEAVGG